MSERTLEFVEEFLVNEYFKDDLETGLRLVFFLQREGENSNFGLTPVRDFLYKQIKRGNPELIKKYVGNVVEDTKKVDENAEFAMVVHDLYAGFNSAKGEKPRSEGWIKAVQDSVVNNIDKSMKDPEAHVRTFCHMTNAMCMLAEEDLPLVIAAFESNAATKSLAISAKGSSALIKYVKNPGKLVVGLVAAQLSWEAIKNIRLWWKGEISGKRCAKNVFDSLGSSAAGAAGGYGGVVAAGYLGLGPAGAVVGGIAGSVCASAAASKLMDKLTTNLFDLPKTAALEKAYKCLGVKHTVGNEEINSAYRKLALKYHPDRKGGDREKWDLLQCSLQVITEARARDGVV